MKKHILSIIITLVSLNSYAQNDISNSLEKISRNEIKINTLTLIVMGAVDLTYERILNEESSIGISTYFAGISDEDTKSYRKYSFTPYYRNYFSNKNNEGFFIEAFGMLYQREIIEETYNYEISADEITNRYDVNGFALGIAAGKKWATKKGFIAEFSLGIGRVVFNSDKDTNIVGRGSLSIGKRF